MLAKMNNLSNNEKGMLIYMHVEGRAKDVLDSIEPEDMTQPDILDKIMALLDIAFDEPDFDRTVRLHKEWESI